MRVAGITLPEEKRVDISLTYLYGIGRSNVSEILKKAGVDGSKRMKSLSDEEQQKIAKVLEEYKLEGDLRAEVTGNIKRLKEIGAYKGTRHAKGLPAHGQRTRSNARTKRGKRMTIGAIKKELATKMEAAQTAKAAPAKK
ncbi:MAG TPA: 30S ribosomal protein S13 [Patescibacteria group bacterium]|nr:30S ribosomal protein S13 [Patescibacteria group bacterium]